MARQKTKGGSKVSRKANDASCTSAPRLLGCADGKVLFTDESGAQHSVTDIPNLLRELEKTCAKHFSMPADIDLGRPLELAVLSVGGTSARCRFLGTLNTITVRFKGSWYRRFVPGHIVTVQPIKQWFYARNAYLSAELLSTKLDIPALGLKPLSMDEMGPWDPKEEMLGNDGNQVGDDPSNLGDIERAIYDAGIRTLFEMEQVLPEADPDNPDTDPILEANDLKKAGEVRAADNLLMRELTADLRCLDAHAHLGNLYFNYRPEDALPHYEVGARIGELSLPPGFVGVLDWGWIDNRPFLRCLNGYGLSLWRLGRTEEALATFERLRWLSPNDNLGTRFNRAAIKDGLSWEELEDRDNRRSR